MYIYFMYDIKNLTIVRKVIFKNDEVLDIWYSLLLSSAQDSGVLFYRIGKQCTPVGSFEKQFCRVEFSY